LVRFERINNKPEMNKTNSLITITTALQITRNYDRRENVKGCGARVMIWYSGKLKKVI
jgi:hypothetical protein